MEIRPEAQIYVASFLKNLIVVFLKKKIIIKNNKIIDLSLQMIGILQEIF